MPSSSSSSSSSSSTKQTQMYPKVKIRADGPDDRPTVLEHNWSSVLSLKDVQSLSLQGSCGFVRRQQDVSPPARARIPKSYVPSVIIPPASIIEDAVVSVAGNNKKSDIDEEKEDKPNIRASSVPRPRAVLSSPENDAVIGNKNKKATRRLFPLGNHRSIQNRHQQCKVIPSHASDEAFTNTRKTKDATDTGTDPKGKKWSMPPLSTRRRTIQTENSSPTRV